MDRCCHSSRAEERASCRAQPVGGGGAPQDLKRRRSGLPSVTFLTSCRPDVRGRSQTLSTFRGLVRSASGARDFDIVRLRSDKVCIACMRLKLREFSVYCHGSRPTALLFPVTTARSGVRCALQRAPRPPETRYRRGYTLGTRPPGRGSRDRVAGVGEKRIAGKRNIL